jgi:predicted amidophosphoribosyltransferase
MRLTKVDPGTRQHLSEDDECYAFGERKPGGYSNGKFNQLIENLKKPVTSKPAELDYKRRAIEECAQLLASAFSDRIASHVTLVPCPPSMRADNPQVDDRMNQVCQRACELCPGIESRRLVITTKDRPKMHEGHRLSPDQLLKYIAITPDSSLKTVRRLVVVVDDVITSGSTFVAVKRLLSQLSGVKQIVGIFIAKQVNDLGYEPL